MNMLMAEGSWAVWSWNTKMLHTSSAATLSLLCLGVKPSKKCITNVEEGYVQDRGRSSQTCGVPQRIPRLCTGWGQCGNRRWAEGSVSSPSSAGSLQLLSPHPAAPLSGSDLTATCCPLAWGHKDRKEVVGGRQVGRTREVLSDRYWPWDHQLLSIMDAIGAAVIIWKSAVDLSLYVVQLQFCGALWWKKIIDNTT